MAYLLTAGIMTTIGYWEASAFFLDSYTTQLLNETSPVYSRGDHLLKIEQGSIIEKVTCIARLIFHHMRVLISSSYKNDFMQRAQKVQNAFRVIEKQEVAEKAVEKHMSKAFSEAWSVLVKRENIKFIDSLLGVSVGLKEPVRLEVPSSEKDLLGGKIILMLGARGKKETQQIKFHFKNDTVTKKDKPKKMSDEDFKNLLGKPIKRMIFSEGFQSYLYYNGTWPLNGYYYPQVSEIAFIDDDNVLLKTGVDVAGVSFGEDPRHFTVVELRASWGSGKPVDDETTALVVKK